MATKTPPRRDDTGRAARIQPKDVEPLPDPGSDPGSQGGGGGGGVKTWVISGRLCVRESEIEKDDEGRPIVRVRNLKGVEVKVSASDISNDGPWTNWGTTRTDSEGCFEVREGNNGKSRFLRVQMRLSSNDLEVNESKIDDLASLDVLDKNWRTVWKSNGQLEGPTVSIGTRTFAAGGGFDLGNETFRRQAVIWYVLRSVVDRLESEDRWFAFKGKFAAIYPAHVVSGTSYANGLTRMIYLHSGGSDNDWHPDVVVHEAMHIWNYDHNHGTTNWIGAICSLRGENPVDLTTHSTQENPNVAFHEGFAEWASNALLHELWGVRKRKPYSRRYVFDRLDIRTLEMVEKYDYTVERALHLLSAKGRNGWYKHEFGTAEEYPDTRDSAYTDEVGKANLAAYDVPDGTNGLSVWDVLRTFRANASRGWPTDWQVGNVDYGIVRFIDRAADIHRLSDDVRLMLKRCIDPLATTEPRDLLQRKRLQPAERDVDPGVLRDPQVVRTL